MASAEPRPSDVAYRASGAQLLGTNNGSADSLPSDVFYRASSAQKVAGILAIISAIAATGMAITWADKHDTSKNYLGGLNWHLRPFNWHPVLMISGMILGLICSLLTYRIIKLPKPYQKLMHFLLHSGSIVCILTGLSAVVTSHNFTDHNKSGTYTANLYSMHSLIGVSAMVLYFSNYILGFVSFLLPVFSVDIRSAIKPHHVFLGLFTLIVGFAAVESGITELTTKLGCIYSVTSADWNPAENYHELSDGCKLANGIGIVVLLAVFFCAYALLGPGATPTTDRTADTNPVVSKMHP
jgi:hypothetical protein